MRIAMENLGSPPVEYEQQFFASMVRSIETALRRPDLAPLYNPDDQHTDNDNPSKAIYSTTPAANKDYEPSNAEDLMTKAAVDAIDAALQTALAELDAARRAAETELQRLIDEIKGDASLIAYDPADSVLVSENVQAAQDEAAGSATVSGNVSYKKAATVPLSSGNDKVALAIDELAGTTSVSGVATYVKATAGVPLLATAMNLAIDELAGTSTGTVSANIYIDPADYDGALSDLAGILDDIDSRLTTLEP